METKSKVILGLKRARDFSLSDRHQIIQEYLSSGKNKVDIWYKYTGQTEEHGQLLKWIRRYGYEDCNSKNEINFARSMKNCKVKNHQPEESFEILQLKKRIAELESKLKDAEMKSIAFSTMVDIAEKEFNVPIRKKFNTKPLK